MAFPVPDSRQPGGMHEAYPGLPGCPALCRRAQRIRFEAARSGPWEARRRRHSEAPAGLSSRIAPDEPRWPVAFRIHR